MHLVGFIIRMYHDALSPERQISLCLSYGFILFSKSDLLTKTESRVLPFDIRATNIFDHLCRHTMIVDWGLREVSCNVGDPRIPESCFAIVAAHWPPAEFTAKVLHLKNVANSSSCHNEETRSIP